MGLVKGFEIKGRSLDRICYFGQQGCLLGRSVDCIVFREANVPGNPTKGNGGSRLREREREEGEVEPLNEKMRGEGVCKAEEVPRWHIWESWVTQERIAFSSAA